MGITEEVSEGFPLASMLWIVEIVKIGAIWTAEDGEYNYVVDCEK